MLTETKALAQFVAASRDSDMKEECENGASQHLEEHSLARRTAGRSKRIMNLSMTTDDNFNIQSWWETKRIYAKPRIRVDMVIRVRRRHPLKFECQYYTTVAKQFFGWYMAWAWISTWYGCLLLSLVFDSNN
jgi:hypothetical protein